MSEELLDHRNPFYILPNENDTNVIEIERPFFFKSIEGVDVACNKLKEIRSPLLQAIDNDDVPMVRLCLKRDHISVNQQYVVPQWEIPEADNYYLQPFLHRAVWEGSFNVFEELIKQGANIKARGYMNTDTIDEVFDPWHQKQTKMVRFGKILLKAGITLEELQKKFKENEIHKSVQNALNHYAKELKKVKINPLLTKGRENTL